MRNYSLVLITVEVNFVCSQIEWHRSIRSCKLAQPLVYNVMLFYSHLYAHGMLNEQGETIIELNSSMCCVNASPMKIQFLLINLQTNLVI